MNTAVIFGFILLLIFDVARSENYELCSDVKVFCVNFVPDLVCNSCVNTIEEALSFVPGDVDARKVDMFEQFSSLSFNLHETYYKSISGDAHENFFYIYVIADRSIEININIKNIWGKRFKISIEPYPGSNVTLLPKNIMKPLIDFSNNTNWKSVFRFRSGRGKLTLINRGNTLIEITKNTGSHLIFEDITIGNDIDDSMENIHTSYIVVVRENNDFYSYFQNLVFEYAATRPVTLFFFCDNVLRSTYEVSNLRIFTLKDTSEEQLTFVKSINSRGYINSNYIENGARNIYIEIENEEKENEGNHFFCKLANNIFERSKDEGKLTVAVSTTTRGNSEMLPLQLFNNLFMGTDLEVNILEDNERGIFNIACNMFVRSKYINVHGEGEIASKNTFTNKIGEFPSSFGKREHELFFNHFLAPPCSIDTSSSFAPPIKYVDFLGRPRNVKVPTGGPFLSLDAVDACDPSECPFPNGICAAREAGEGYSCHCLRGEYAGERCQCHIGGGYVYSETTNECICNSEDCEKKRRSTIFRKSLNGVGAEEENDGYDNMTLVLVILICPVAGLTPILCIYMVCVCCIEAVVVCSLLAKSFCDSKLISPENDGPEDEGGADGQSIARFGSIVGESMHGSTVGRLSTISEDHEGLRSEKILDLDQMDHQMLEYRHHKVADGKMKELEQLFDV